MLSVNYYKSKDYKMRLKEFDVENDDLDDDSASSGHDLSRISSRTNHNNLEIKTLCPSVGAFVKARLGVVWII